MCHDCHDNEFPGGSKVLIRKYPEPLWDLIALKYVCESLIYDSRDSHDSHDNNYRDCHDCLTG
jgi:hypothetical protein